MKLFSPSFNEGGQIPRKYTCRGENLSPQIIWGDVPNRTVSMVLIMEDPDIPIPRFILPVWTHWIVYNIDPDVMELPEGMQHTDIIDKGVLQGITSFRKTGYNGPCPPFGTHRYFFRLYALDTIISVEPRSATRKNILYAVDGHILDSGELMGVCSRKKP